MVQVKFNKTKMFVEFIGIDFSLLDESIDCVNDNIDKAAILVKISNNAWGVRIEKINIEFALDTTSVSICRGTLLHECKPLDFLIQETIPATPIPYWKGSEKSLTLRACFPKDITCSDFNVSVTLTFNLYSRDSNNVSLKPEIISNNIHFQR